MFNKLFREYKGLRRENYILFFGRLMTNLGAMIWPVLTMILDQKLGMSAEKIAGYSSTHSYYTWFISIFIYKS